MLECDISDLVYPLPAVTWIFNGNPLPKNQIDEEFTLHLDQIDLSNAGTYTCLVENIAGKLSISYDLKIVDKPSAEILPAKSIEKLEKESLYLNCKIAGFPTPTITWYFIPDVDYNSPEFNFQDNFSYLKDKNSNWQANNDHIKNIGLGQMIHPSKNIVFSKDYSKLTINSLTAEQTGEYECRAENKIGIASDFTSVQVYAKPKFETEQVFAISSAKIEEVEVLFNASLNLSCRLAGGFPIPEIYWYFGGKIVDFLHDFIELPVDNSEIYIDRVTADMDKKIVSCEATNLAGSIQKKYRIKIVMPPKKVGNNYVEITSVLNQNVQIDCQIEASRPFEVIWYKNDQEINFIGSYDIRKLEYKEVQAETSVDLVSSIAPISLAGPNSTKIQDYTPIPKIVQSIKIYNVKTTDKGEYTCKVMNKAGSNQHISILNVYQAPEIVGFPLQYIEVIEGDSLDLTCQIFSDPLPEISWYFEGMELEGLNINTIGGTSTLTLRFGVFGARLFEVKFFVQGVLFFEFLGLKITQKAQNLASS